MALNRDPIKISLVRLGVWLLCVLWLLGLAWWHRRVVMDDPYITYHYAHNVISGKGWVYNPGEYIEGYSNFTWVLATIPALAFQIDPLSWTRFLGLLSVVGIFTLLIFGVCRDKEGNSRFHTSCVAAALLAAQWPVAVWAMGGLETTFYALLLIVYILCVDWYWRSRAQVSLWLNVGLLSLLSMTRPEGAMWGILLLAPFLDKNRKEFTSDIIKMIIGFAIVYAIYNFWRLYTFGDLIPNTVRAKVGGGAGSSIIAGWKYIYNWVWGPPVLLVIFAAIALADSFFSKNKSTQYDDDDRLGILCGIAISWQCIFIFGTGGDWMPGFRFIVPILAPLVLLASLLIEKWPIFVRATVVGFFLFAAPISAKFDPATNWSRWQPKATDLETNVDVLIEVGKHLHAIGDEDDYFAATEAGALAYYSELNLIDMLGLVDAHIASLPGGLHQKFDADYVLGREPRFMVLGFTETAEGRVGTWEPDREIAAHPSFTADYEPVKEWPRFMPDGKYEQLLPGAMVLYAHKKGSPATAPAE